MVTYVATPLEVASKSQQDHDHGSSKVNRKTRLEAEEQVVSNRRAVLPA